MWDGYLGPYIRPGVAVGPCNYQVSMGRCVIFALGEMLIWPCQQPPGWMSPAPQSTGSPSLCTKDKLVNFSQAGHSNLGYHAEQISSTKRLRLTEPRLESSKWAVLQSELWFKSAYQLINIIHLWLDYCTTWCEWTLNSFSFWSPGYYSGLYYIIYINYRTSNHNPHD